MQIHDHHFLRSTLNELQQETSAVAHAILIGFDLCPNLSVTGSLATILWLMLYAEKVEIAAWEFFKIGIIVMPLALIASLLVLWN